MMFPSEIYEIILYHADGRTLLRARLVCKQWKAIVEYLEKKHNIWKKCCKNDIPKHILYSIKDKCCFVDLKQQWKFSYRSYISLQNLKHKEHYVLPRQSDDYFENNITCSKISGSRIIYGNTSGIICVLNEAYEVEDVLVTDIRGSLTDIVFINRIESDENSAYKHTHAVLIYEKWFLILKLEPKIKQIGMFQYCKHASVYKDHIAYISPFLIVTVAKINLNESDAYVLQQLNFCRLYENVRIRSLCLYDNLLIYTTDKEVFTLDYQKENIARPIQSFVFPFRMVERYWSFYNQVIFCTSNSTLYFSTIGVKNTVIRTFDCMQNLESQITDILLHGNILILGLLNGNVFMYVVDDWSEFDLKSYDLKICLYGEPICSIDVQELEDEHRLLLTMNDYIAQVFIYHFS